MTSPNWRDHTAVGKCPTCRKIRFVTRSGAKRWRSQRHGGQGMGVYPCGDYWHVGHTPKAVRAGEVPRADFQSTPRWGS